MYLRFLWLVVFALLSLVGNGRFAPLAAWLAPVFAIRFYRQSERGGRGFLWLWLVTAVTSSIVWNGATAMHFLGPFAEPLFMTLMSPIALLPFVVDRLFHRRWASHPQDHFWLTFVFPISYTAIDFISASGSPFGSFGAVAYSQIGFTAFLQTTAVLGIWGIPFIMGWFASVINYMWEADFRWAKIQRGATLLATLLLLLFGLGHWRTTFAVSEPQDVAIGGYSLSEETFGATLELAQTGNETGFRAAAANLNAQHITEIRKLAQQGAQIISLQEGAGMGYAEEIDVLLADASRLAQEEGIYIVLPTVMLDPANDGPFHNVVRIIDPKGDIVLEHYKFGGTQFEGSITGNGELQSVDTPYGKLSAVICWDADFPAVMKQTGEQGVDLLFVPSNDWFEIRDLHAGMATLRAIENGVPIFRQTGSGVSTVIDVYGNEVSRIDSFAESSAGLWSSEQIAMTPTGSVNTLFPRVGDLFGQIMLAGWVGLLGFAWLKRKRGVEQVTTEPVPTPAHTH